MTTSPADLERVVQRNRRIDGSDEIANHNAWDDVPWTEEETLCAEAIVAAQRPRDAADAPPDPTEQAREAWERYYLANLRGYKDRHYLHSEFPQLLAAKSAITILETGCGVGNALVPLLAGANRARLVGCDVSANAVARLNERLEREGLGNRGRAVVWDITMPAPSSLWDAAGVAQGEPFADLALAVFTLSAVAPSLLVSALANLRDCLRPGGAILFRDYGRLDLKQLKFARKPNARLPCEGGWEWYSRGDGTTAAFFDQEKLETLAAEVGLGVEWINYDKRLILNRAEAIRMQRVWIAAVLRKPCEAGVPHSSSARNVLFAATAAAVAGMLILRATRSS